MSILKTIAPRTSAELLKVGVEGSQLQPVGFMDAKNYARVSGDEDDIIIDVLVLGAIEDFQAYTGKLIFHQQVTAIFKPKEYESVLYLPWLPVVDVISVENEDGAVNYELKGDYIEADSAKELTVVYTAGLHEELPVSSDIQLGCFKWILSNYEDRQDTAGMTVQRMPNGSKSHWLKYKNTTI
jgi:uncharacterized phiE125 gp8 family phage protein